MLHKRDSSPLSSLSIPFLNLSQESASTISNGLLQNHCVTTYIGLLDNTLIKGMGTSKNFAYLGGYFDSSVDADTVTKGITDDTCFLDFIDDTVLPLGIQEWEVQDIVDGREACVTKPQCKTFQTKQVCEAPSPSPYNPAPGNPNSPSNSKFIGAVIGALGGGSIFTAVIIFLWQKFRRRGYQEQA